MDSERDDVELSSTAEYTLSQACRFKAERDQLRQRVDALEEWSDDVEHMYRYVFDKLVDEMKETKRLGKLVWRLQNRLARSHRRERNLRKGMRMWREKAIDKPQVTMSAYDMLPEEDLQALRWVREQGGLDVVKTHAELFQQLKSERDEYRDLCREYEKRLMPEGCKWPRYESGESVQFGDTGLDVYGKRRMVKGVKFTQGGFAFISDDKGRTWWANDRGPLEDPEINPDKSVKRPVADTWERLEEDARQLDIDLNDTTDDYPRMSCCRDLVRRAKALAGVSE